jgi:hypothetical protein
MKLTPSRIFGGPDNKTMHSLIEPDDSGPWAMRYLWIQHLEDNNKFYDSYFNQGNQQGYNVRKQTVQLKTDWDYHNQIFFDSAKNGNLIWRVKMANKISQSIDYIEIWKTEEILTGYFGDKDVRLDDNKIWKNDDRKKFAEHLYNTGFDIRFWKPYPLISKKCAMMAYKRFVECWKNRDGCIINTPWNRELNPL